MANTYICEVCDKVEELTVEEAYKAGWDYPPFLGAWGAISARTCGDCGIRDTAWWQLAVEKKSFEELSEKHGATVVRIVMEVPHE